MSDAPISNGPMPARLYGSPPRWKRLVGLSGANAPSAIVRLKVRQIKEKDEQHPRAGDSAIVSANVNLRSGLGTDSEILSTIPAGSTVRVGKCEGEWCAVTWSGQNGYAIARNLDLGGSRQANVYPRQPRYRRPGYGPRPGYYYGPPVVYGPGYYGQVFITAPAGAGAAIGGETRAQARSGFTNPSCAVRDRFR